MFYMTEKILMDGIELVQEHPVTIVYNRDTMELSIKYRMQRLNKHGNFQFAWINFHHTTTFIGIL